MWEVEAWWLGFGSRYMALWILSEPSCPHVTNLLLVWWSGNVRSWSVVVGVWYMARWILSEPSCPHVTNILLGVYSRVSGLCDKNVMLLTFQCWQFGNSKRALINAWKCLNHIVFLIKIKLASFGELKQKWDEIRLMLEWGSTWDHYI